MNCRVNKYMIMIINKKHSNKLMTSIKAIKKMTSNYKMYKSNKSKCKRRKKRKLMSYK